MLAMHPVEWQVELAISGPLAVERPISLQVEKGEIHPFLTTVSLKNTPNGILLTLIARAYDQSGANDAAVYFVGQALDVLALRDGIPIYLNLNRPEFRNLDTHIRRLITKHEWLDAFQSGRRYSMERPYLSRALSWYRKGITAEDPVDKLIGYWSALEAIGAACSRDNERTRRGSINQICDCFDQIWGQADKWQVIPGNPAVLEKFNEHRNGISHGFIRIDIEFIRGLVAELPLYQQIATTFLRAWEHLGSNIEVQIARARRQQHEQIPANR